MNRLHGKIAIITGVSRSKGIESAIGRALAREGADIFFTRLSMYDGRQTYGAEYQSVNAVDPGQTDTGWMENDLKQTCFPSFPWAESESPGMRRS